MSKRMKQSVYRDQITEQRLCILHKRESAECALLYAFLDRYCACQHNCGLWRHSPDDMALALGLDSDDVRGLLNSLSPWVLFDPEAHLILNVEQMEQYHEFGRANNNMRKGVEKHLSTLPDSPLKERLCNQWSLDFESVGDLVLASLNERDATTREREKKEPLPKGLPKGLSKGLPEGFNASSDAPSHAPSDAPSEKGGEA